MKITHKQNEYLVNTYLDTKNTRLTLDSFEEKYHFRPSKSHLHDKLEEKGIKRNSRGGANNGLDKQEFLDLYEICSGNLEDIATATGNKLNSIFVRCRKYGLSCEGYHYHYKTEKSNIDEKYDKVFSSPFRH